MIISIRLFIFRTPFCVCTRPEARFASCGVSCNCIMFSDKIKVMAKKEEPKKDKYEKIKYIGLGALVVAILGGSFVLFWQINKQDSLAKGDPFQDANAMQSQVTDLNKKIEDLNKALDDAKKSSSSSTTVKTTTKNGTVAGAETSSSDVSGQININTASAGELDALPGIGPTYAQRIIDYREANGGFNSIEEIENVKGIGPATFAKMKDRITI